MNAPAMPGRLITWWLWLNDYEPVELIVDGQTITDREAMLRWLASKEHQFGTAIGNEWRAGNGRWSMRGKDVHCATDPTT
jgi:hypothetical protein